MENFGPPPYKLYISYKLCISYRKLQPLISAFIENSIFGNYRDPCLNFKNVRSLINDIGWWLMNLFLGFRFEPRIEVAAVCHLWGGDTSVDPRPQVGNLKLSDFNTTLVSTITCPTYMALILIWALYCVSLSHVIVLLGWLWFCILSVPTRTFQWGVDSVHHVKFSPVEFHLLGAAASDRSIILYDTREVWIEYFLYG